MSTKKRNKYFEGCVSLDDMSLANAARVTAALSELEALSKEGVITFEFRDANAAKAVRSDRKASKDKKIQPQQQRIIDFLLEHPNSTSDEVKIGLGIPEGSANAALNTLLHRGITHRDDGWPRRWRLAPEATPLED